MKGRILLLGGVGDALWLARQLGPGHVYSLAGMGRTPTDLVCELRTGGFGGIEGLIHYVRDARIDLLVDATHPYAAQMSRHAAAAAKATGVPCWALRRPAWEPQAGDDWRDFTRWSELQQALKPFERPFFTLGREPLEHLSEIPAHQHWTIRLLEPQLHHLRATFIATRGPFDAESERALFTANAFDVLISKNSGGAATDAKLHVARQLKLPVLMMKRPLLPKVDRLFTCRQTLLAELLGESH
ncbi:cobalt-precorrin-6A reductase [Pseudomonas matsuisoli]|uniref:Cobalt-precorrin-6A reductase n=1 Tax=Pseudomonas matsuisoli TaxID=1515666 RepID=A0A917UTZ4_9PSED|nr:cobalt-precorrin-6A reductase [Pseudomonas matsuisoli]GGJ85003.1 cobalt-precorrin-6A reductase [Pseudomonas matsuisoli]